MHMKIEDVFSYGSDRMTTQTQWHIQASINGQPVDIFYLDAGNNAEYKEDLRVTAPTQACKDAIEAWYEDGNDFTKLEPGDTVTLTKQAPAPTCAVRPTPPAGPRR